MYMATLAELSRREQRRRDEPRQAREARVAEAPTAADEPIYVEFVKQSGYRRGPCYGWLARPDDTWPAKGDSVAVIETDTGKLVVITWWPADG
jgi:hypothetical protein